MSRIVKFHITQDRADVAKVRDSGPHRSVAKAEVNGRIGGSSSFQRLKCPKRSVNLKM
jgi:hypothetical protein